MAKAAATATGLLLLATPVASQQAAPAEPAVIIKPTWVRKPSPFDIQKLYPAAAILKGDPGRAVINCVVATTGALRSCRVIEETPAGLGFGNAAMAMAHLFLMKPSTKNGAPVEARITIPINFKCDGGCRPVSDKDFRTVVTYTSVNWEAAPTVAEVLAAYPAEARKEGLSGRVALRCKFAAGGKLGDCNTTEELPSRKGFAKAASSLIPAFRGPAADKTGKSTAGSYVILNIAFSKELAAQPSPPAIEIGRWMKAPTSAQLQTALAAEPKVKGSTFGISDMNCLIGAAGVLTDCKVETEKPEGFGAVSVALAPYYAASPWTEEGLPVVGGRTRINLKFGKQP